MKTTITKNLVSAVMLAILSPFLALAIIVSVRTAGVVGNDVLLLLLTLLSAVLSGINGFGRRTARSTQLTPTRAKSASDIQSHRNNPWSPSPSTHA